MLARQKVGAFTIKQTLGHRSINSAAIYASITDAEADRAATSAFMAAFLSMETQHYRGIELPIQRCFYKGFR